MADVARSEYSLSESCYDEIHKVADKHGVPRPLVVQLFDSIYGGCGGYDTCEWDVVDGLDAVVAVAVKLGRDARG